MSEKLQEIRIKQHLSTFTDLCELEHRLQNGEAMPGVELDTIQQERKLLRALLVGLRVSETLLNDIAFHVRTNGEGK